MGSDNETELSELPSTMAAPLTVANGKIERPQSPVPSSRGLPHGKPRRDQRPPHLPPKTDKPQPKLPEPRQDLFSTLSPASIPIGPQRDPPERQDDDNLDEDFGQDTQDDVGGDIFETSQSRSSSKRKTFGQKKRPKTSLVHSETTHVTENGIECYKCNHCEKTYAKSGGGTMMQHLNKIHGLYPAAKGKALKQQREDSAVATGFARVPEVAQATNEKRRHLLELDFICKEMLEYFYLRWTVAQDIPFSQVENHDFRVFLNYLSPAANDLLPRSHNSIRSQAMDLFSEGKERIRQIFQSAVSKIHITCDLWTSPNHLGILGIIAHFTGEDLELQALTIGLREVQGAHTGENLASVVMDVLRDYKIEKRIGYFMMDNASTNNTLVVAIARELQSMGITYDPRQRRLRCSGHIINLVVNAFLSGKISNDIEYLETDENEDLVRVATNDELGNWRQIGPLGKLHNIVVFISKTPQRKQRFKQLSGGLLLYRDNSTRWNSWYSMLDWALNRTKEAIISFCAGEDEIRHNTLTDEDWKTLQSIRDFLRYFYDATKVTEGREATLETFLPTMEFLAFVFKEARGTYADNPNMLGSIDASYTKFLYYFNLQERTPAYVAAVVLNPERKWTLFRKWKPKDIAKAKSALTKLWKNDYRGNTSLPIYLEPAIESESENTCIQWLHEQEAFGQGDESRDELERYLDSDDTINTGGIGARKWWAQSSQRAKYPRLSLMAIDIMSVPAMSSEVERVFSGAKKTISQGRWKLNAESIDALECLESWFRADLLCQRGALRDSTPAGRHRGYLNGGRA